MESAQENKEYQDKQQSKSLQKHDGLRGCLKTIVKRGEFT